MLQPEINASSPPSPLPSKPSHNNEPPQYQNYRERTWWEKLTVSNTHYSSLLDRTIISNHPDRQLPSNKISTAKYNMFTFLPLNIIQQFSKPSNVYFLTIGILQIIPSITVSDGKPTIFLPLFIVLIVSMIKDFIEDWKRHANDKKENETSIEVLRQFGFKTLQWKDIQVGDILRIEKDQYFPCDVLLLKHGINFKSAFIDTKNLDGETNLKLRTVCPVLQSCETLSDVDLFSLELQVAFEKPNPFLTTFTGNIQLDHTKPKHPLNNTNIILRGCSLKINYFAIGMCLYSGHETKILLNSGERSRKESKLEQHLNQYFRFMFLFQLLVTLISAIVHGIIMYYYQDDLGYINEGNNVLSNIVATWGSWFISFSNFIPISLLVTVEIVRFGQGLLLAKDPLCMCNNKQTEVQTSSINEELGQIEYVLSDKTGTLTQNLMQFKCLYVNGVTYGDLLQENNEQEQEKHHEELNNTTHEQSTPTSMLKEELLSEHPELLLLNSKRSIYVDFSELHRDKLHNELLKENERAKQIHEALLHISLCHNAIREENSFSSSSPDELALVSFAKFMGYNFLTKTDEQILEVELCLPHNKPIILKYQLLHVLEFNSERKRMSIIIRDNNNRIMLLCKGADDVILQRVAITNEEKVFNKQQLEDMHNTLNTYACEGLRTLVFAQKYILEEDYIIWDMKYSEAITMIGPERLEAISELQSELEKGLSLVGATAIEDKLQPHVKETIQGLKSSNIKVWMLTGDKKETAVSIGFSCGLLNKNSERITLDCEAEHSKLLLKNLTDMMHLLPGDKITIVSGDFINRLDEESRCQLEDLLKQCESVICCRVSPKDKEEITKMVRKWGITLAVGDGANDVNMINCAHVGIGVRGIEGSQATRAADYVIGEFRILHRLIVYHGANYYHRNANVMLYTLYKNMVATFPFLAYGPLSVESGTYIYDIWVFQLYNIFYVCLPIIYFGLFDISYSHLQIQTTPLLYTIGQECQIFNRNTLLHQLLSSILTGTLLIYVVYFASGATISHPNYMVYEEWQGMTVLVIVIFICNLRIITISNQINLVQALLCLIGILSYYFMFEIISLIFDSDTRNTLRHELSSPVYWLLVSIIFIEIFLLVYFVTVYEFLVTRCCKKNNEFLLKNEINEREMEEKLGITIPVIGKEEIGGYAFAEDENRPNVI